MKFFLCFALVIAAASSSVLGQPQPAAISGYEIVEKRIPHRDVRKAKILRGVKAPDGSMAIDYGTYSYIKPYAGTLFVVGKGLQQGQFVLPETYGLYDAAARKEIHASTAKQLHIYSECVAQIHEAAGTWILIDRQGKMLGGQRYNSVAFDPRQPVSRVSVRVSPKSYKNAHGFVDPCGNPVTPLHYDRVGYFKEGFVSVCREGKYTFIDSSGKEVMPPTYAYLTDFSNGVAAFSNRGSYDELKGQYTGSDWGFINTRGEELGTARYEQIANATSFVVKGGEVDVKLGGKWLSVNPLSASQADGVPVVSGARWIAFQERAPDRGDQDKQPWGFRIDGGDVMLKPQWDAAGGFEDGLAIVGKNAPRAKGESSGLQREYLWGLIDQSGKEVIPLRYREIRRLDDGLFVFAEGHGAFYEDSWRHGLMDRTGKIVLPALYSRFGRLSDGMIAVRQDKRDRFIDIKGEDAIPGTFAQALDFVGGYAIVTQTGKDWYWIDTHGKPLLPGKTFLGLSYFTNGKADVWTTRDAWDRNDGKQTIDTTGKVLVIHPLNPPPSPQDVRCPACSGGGGRYANVEHTSTTTEVDNYNARAPGAKLIIERTRSWTESKRIGDCFECSGKGTVSRAVLPRR
jgi:hypothetical protein